MPKPQALNPSLKECLESLLVWPATTTYERYTHSAARRLLTERRIPWRLDRYGNIHAGDLKSRQPVVFAAHLDHPGFSFTAAGKRVETLRWWGSVRKEYFPKSRVRVYPYDERELKRLRSQAIEGTIRSVHTEKGTIRPNSATAVFDEPLEKGRTYIGNWALMELKMAGGWVESIRIDDLVGSACIAELLTRLRGQPHVRAMFTRAEEDGFHGALAGARFIPEKALIVSVETSSERAGAVPGKGPIVRLGDASSVFDPYWTRLLDETASALAKTDPSFYYQKRVMDGGSCEATAFLALGFRATGVAVSLVNYHNMGKRKLAAEKIAKSDTEQLLQLMEAFARNYHGGKGEPVLVKRIRERVKVSSRLLDTRVIPGR